MQAGKIRELKLLPVEGGCTISIRMGRMDPEPPASTCRAQTTPQSAQDLPAPGAAKGSQREPSLGTQTRRVPMVSRNRLRSDERASCVCVVSGLCILQVPLQKPPPLFFILFFHNQRFPSTRNKRMGIPGRCAGPIYSMASWKRQWLFPYPGG